MSGVYCELCKWIFGVLYLVKGILIRNTKTGQIVPYKGVNFVQKLDAMADLWGLTPIDFDRTDFGSGVQEANCGQVVLHYGMAGSLDPGVTLALAGLGTENLKLGDNTVHIGGDNSAGMAAARAFINSPPSGDNKSPAFGPFDEDKIQRIEAAHILTQKLTKLEFTKVSEGGYPGIAAGLLEMPETNAMANLMVETTIIILGVLDTSPELKRQVDRCFATWARLLVKSWGGMAPAAFPSHAGDPAMPLFGMEVCAEIMAMHGEGDAAIRLAVAISPLRTHGLIGSKSTLQVAKGGVGQEELFGEYLRNTATALDTFGAVVSKEVWTQAIKKKKPGVGIVSCITNKVDEQAGQVHGPLPPPLLLAFSIESGSIATKHQLENIVKALGAAVAAASWGKVSTHALAHAPLSHCH
jgi:hypothetical protein